MAREPSGCSSTLAFIVSLVIALGVAGYQEPRDGVLLLLLVWATGYVALMALPSIWETVLLNARRLRRRR